MPLLLLALAVLLIGGAVVYEVSSASPSEFTSTLAALVGSFPDVPGIAVDLIVAHAAYESDWGKDTAAAAFNFFNITRGPNDAGPALPGPDMAYSQDGTFLGSITQRWRSYDSAFEGVRDYLRLLAVPRYSAARDQLFSGDENWVTTLGRAGYYTLPVADYQRGYLARLADVRSYLGA
jgi:flagellar protein FlgJ